MATTSGDQLRGRTPRLSLVPAALLGVIGGAVLFPRPAKGVRPRES